MYRAVFYEYRTGCRHLHGGAAEIGRPDKSSNDKSRLNTRRKRRVAYFGNSQYWRVRDARKHIGSDPGAIGLDFATAVGGTCTVGASYNAGDSCTVNVIFTPTAAGVRYGAIILQTSGGTVVGTSYLQGVGSGPQIEFLPGTESTVPNSGSEYPFGVAVDASGNVYVADTGNNRVLKETLAGNSYTETTVATSTLSFPSAVAVDGAGSLYIADTGNNRVLKETFSAGNYGETTIPSSALSYPAAVAVDGNGDVYVADSGNNRILMEALSGGSYTESTISTSSLSYPSGLAVDVSGNIYISDAGNNRVLKETVSGESYSESVLTTSTLSYPAGIAVDGTGDVYIADWGNARVLREILQGSSYVESTVSSAALTSPSAVAVASKGNLYIADVSSGQVLEEDYVDAPVLSFAPTAPGATSSDSPQVITVENSGNAALNFPVPGSGTNPSIAVNFSLGGASTCPVVNAGASSAGALADGQSCTLAVSFVPTTTGILSASLTLTDNSLNASGTQSIRLRGTGTGSTSQTISFGSIGAQNANTTLGLVATATSGLPVSFSSMTPSVCTVSGTTAMLAAGGTCTIQASQPGNSTYAAAAPVTQSFAVNLLSQTITFPAIPNQSINTAVPVALGATASSGLPISYTSLTTAVCTVSGSAATLVKSGTCTIQASQPGDGVVYAAAASVTQSFTVTTANPLTGTGFGSLNIGSTSAAAPVTVTMSAAGTAAQLSVVTEGVSGLDFAAATGGTCAINTGYNAGDSCTVEVTFAPRAAGSRYGAVVIVDGSGNCWGPATCWGPESDRRSASFPAPSPLSPTTRLAYPFGFALDASGNVYIADTGNNRVLKEIAVGNLIHRNHDFNERSEFASGVAVDGAGNLYIADTGNNRVLKEAFSAGNYTETTIPSSALSYPAAVAVDGNGDVYIADSGNNRILMEALSGESYTESTIPTSTLSYPSGLAVDVSGNIYIADSGNNRILMESFSGGNYTERLLPTSALLFPEAVALDGNGDVYIADSGNARILKETVVARRVR